MDPTEIDLAAARAGIADSYIGADNLARGITHQTREKLLAAMKYGGPAPAVGLPVPVVQVFRQGSRVTLPIAGTGEYHWTLDLEDGGQQQGRTRALTPLTLPELPQGYHELTLHQGERQWQCRLIIAPPRCFEPPALLAGHKLWGTCIQLYTLRSVHNWGIGDFGDLYCLVNEIGVRGGAFVGLNPLHALYPASPDAASPYSPSSRRWLNIVYIDVNAVPAFQQSAEAQQWWRQTATQEALNRVRASSHVDYPGVTALKLTALRLAYAWFAALPAEDEQQQALQTFIVQGGDSLYQQAVFDALYPQMLAEGHLGWGWPFWPQAYQDGQSQAVAAFCRTQREEVRFHLWLQWLAATQFARCYQQSRQQNMPIGLYRDLAVGVAAGGAETWGDPDLYCRQASIGAPPDLLGPQGQNWGLPPMDPHVMTERGYQPFIDLLRANMGSCGALRIDHVMALLRLWWIPAGETADQGAYVHYPVEDLLAVLALESQRHRCMVIGEDLGTVPQEIVSKLRDNGIYSYKVLYFEHDSEQVFRAPPAYPVQAMATITTHDLPTLRGYWQGDDLALGQKLGIYPEPLVLAQRYAERQQAKQGLLDGLHRAGCVPENVERQAERVTMNQTLNLGVQRYVADSASALVGLQPEEWLDMAAPVNIPGTSSEFPNWRRKLSQTLEAMFAEPWVNHLLQDLDTRRRRGTREEEPPPEP